MENNKVLAVVNGKDITEKDVNSLLNSLDPQRKAQFSSPDGKKQILNEIITQELFYLHANEIGMDKDEAYLKELEYAKQSLLKQYAIRKTLSEANVTEQEVIDYYEQNKDNFKNPESAKASHILVDTEEQANEIAEEIKSGLSFEDAAKKYSKCPSKDKGGDLGFFTRGRMVPEFENAAFSMEKDEISEPVKTQFGFHLIKLADKQPEKVISFDEIKDNLTNQIASMKQNDLYYSKSKELREKYEVVIND